MTSTTLPAPPSKRPNAGMLTGILALLTAVAPLSIDMYLPAFPHMAHDLNTSATGIQLTMTAFLVGLALGQLVIGPLSDGVGRRKPLLVGSFVALLATVLCAAAPNVEILATARFLQGLGGAAGIVLARAIVSDTSRGAAAAKLLGVLTMISVIAPVIGPLAGGGIIAAGGWRMVFWVLAVLVLLMFLGALFGVKETLPDADRNRGGLKTTFRVAGEVLRNRNYTGYLLTFCFSFAGLFAYIAASPFVIQNILGMSETRFSLVFAMNAVAITIVSAVAAALAGKAPYRLMIAVGLSVAVLAAAGMLISVSNGTPTVPTLVLFAVFQGSLGLIFGNATALALEEAGHHAGTGSAFLGSLQFLLAALVSPLVGLWGEETGVPMGVAMLGFLVLAAASFLLLTRASVEAPAEEAAAV
ncbi:MULTISPECIES: multidrug effflux MFS transporter [unclassified Arthrobacter]|uniref:multidrug effflux MFS transporter n=1 Tax=unclassified Arthrobacter TaxID=235627 RepID=UPI002104845A|nr:MULTISPECIES: multidrug effflux MFS transporter [unclassified Arthrobacter]MCQ1946137.1 multidrug effflux MFS transporter [Arthrobacter sp. zg-Y1116]MCQ1994182.1 multidrug effflux MFS transporter [Arthrobacter sp. zg-Y1171]UWX81718.1 multidrug effflux MFS transporter [Arthrobacter sp. zg-Y1171]